MRFMKAIKWMGFLFLAAVTSLEAGTFELDQAHTTMGFRVRHLLTYVSGRFSGFSGSFETDKSGNLIKAEAIIQAKTINTDNQKRDDHLRSPDFFDVSRFPEIKFVSQAFSIKKGASGKMPGTLTLHGVSKPVSFDVEWFGDVAGPGGVVKAGASARLKINRKDYGLNWSKTLETGGVLVGDEVEIVLDIEGNLKSDGTSDSVQKTKKEGK